MGAPSMPDQELPDHLVSHFQKSNFFRVVLAEGCFGGLSPRGKIHCSFYNERTPIPQMTSLPLKDGLPSGAEEITAIKSGVIREVEVDIVMDLQAAAAYSAWLVDKVEQLRQALGITDADFAKMKGVPQ